VIIVQLLVSLELLAGIQIGIYSRIGCNSELAETNTNYSFHLSNEMGIVLQDKRKRTTSHRCLTTDKKIIPMRQFLIAAKGYLASKIFGISEHERAIK
jgi:hypothetical protein